MTRRTNDLGIVHLRDVYRLTIAEATGLARLARGGIVPSEDLRDIYCDSPDAPPEQARQMMKWIRRKIIGIEIRTHYGIGYELHGDSLRVIRSVMAYGRELARSA